MFRIELNPIPFIRSSFLESALEMKDDDEKKSFVFARNVQCGLNRMVGESREWKCLARGTVSKRLRQRASLIREYSLLGTPLHRDRWIVIASASKRDAGADR